MAVLIIMQVWETPKKEQFVRVLHEGTPVPTLEWVDLGSFISLLESNVPSNLFEQCTST